MNSICPTKIEKIVLGADACEFCEGATRESIRLARICGSKLYAVSVIEVNQEFEALAPKLVEEMERETRGFLLSVKLRASKEGVDCEVVAHLGEEAYEYIVAEAKQKGADMIILGRRGRKGIKRLLMGSVTAKVIGHAPCCVLVVPRKAETEFKKILLATDGSKWSQSAAAEAISIAKRMGSPITAVCVGDSEVKDPSGTVEAVVSQAGKEGVRAEGQVLAGRTYEAIIAAAKKTGADAIVMGKHGRTGFDKIMMGSVTERVIGLSECAVLVVKA